MPGKLVLKRLTASDLTLFKWHFYNRPAGKQKAFNLDAAVLVDELYPQLAEPSPVPQPRYPLDLYLFGPGMAPADNLQRKILKQHKNWRLNGELIDNPAEAPERYNILAPGDFALFEFSGESVPRAAKVVFVARAVEADAGIHVELDRKFPGVSMALLEPYVLFEALNSAKPSDDHPLHDWVDSDALEDAALGGAAGAAVINARRSRRGISPEDFMRSRRVAEMTGVAGEVLLNDYFEKKLIQGEISDFEWTASINAISPFDFRLVTDGAARFVDAKSTSGSFGNPIHISFNELNLAVEGAESYDIYRLYDVAEDCAKMRIAKDIGPSLREVLQMLKKLPSGISVDGVSVSPEFLPFTAEEILLNISVGE